MRKYLAATVLGAAVAGLSLIAAPARGQLAPAPAPSPASPAAQDAKAQVPVKAVVLFSSGVGYFEHYGVVNGTGSTELRFKTQQINDILKSLVLQDLDGGVITTISYPSQDPLSKTLRSFQVDITSNPGLGELLTQLRGATVKISLAGEQAQGTILGLEKKLIPTGKDSPPVEAWFLNLIDGGTIQAIRLDNVQKLELVDKELQDELQKALLALSQARDQDKKPVTINFSGQGQRHVRLGYVVETPVWKTSYRLLLTPDANPAQKDAKAEPGQPAAVQPAGGSKDMLQGWAIVENQTDNDWNNVELSLVSGRPISFIQDLYQPLYVPRPVVQPELYASLMPQTYDAGMRGLSEEAKDFGMKQVPGAAADGVIQLKRASGVLSLGGQVLSESAEAVAASPPPMNAASSIVSVASAAKMGELFEYTVGSVSLPRQRSAMIPIINDGVEVERLSIYNPNVLARNPLNGARVKNTSGKHLLQGPITVFDNGSYAGDASIDNVPPGQERLISYGVDLQMMIDATKNKQDNTIQTGKIVKGVLTVTYKNVFSQEYLAENKGDKEKTLIIEHPLRQGWKLVETDKPLETTETLYRFKGTVPAGKQTKLTVREQIVQGQEMVILPTDPATLEYYAKSGEIPQAVRDVLAKAVVMKNAITDTQRQLEEHRQQLAKITQEQTRIRENMKTVSPSSQYYNRLMAKLNDQENQIEKLQGEVEGLQKNLDQQQKDLEDYLAHATVE